jgi:hypothetical protein
MANITTDLETRLVIKQIKIEAEAKARIEEITRIRLGVAPGFATSASQRETTERAMKAAGIGGQEGAMKLGTTLTQLVGSIQGLNTVLTTMKNNSKIYSKTSEAVARLLGLLVDVVLMPFIGLIAWGIISLAKGIMNLYGSMKDLQKKGFLQWAIDLWV